MKSIQNALSLIKERVKNKITVNLNEEDIKFNSFDQDVILLNKFAKIKNENDFEKQFEILMEILAVVMEDRQILLNYLFQLQCQIKGFITEEEFAFGEKQDENTTIH